MNWKHYSTGEVISDSTYQRLTREKQLEYRSTYESVSNDILDDAVSLGIGLAIGGILGNGDDSVTDTESLFGGFGEGDAGGAGASGEW